MCAIAAIGVAEVLFSISASAATLTWDASGNGTTLDGSGTWSTSIANWWNGSADSGWTGGANSAVFGAAAGSNPYSVTLGSNAGMAVLTFASQSYTIAPDAGGLYGLTIGSGGIAANVSATIGAPLTLRAAQTWTVAAGQALNVGGPISGGYGLTEAGSGLLTLSGSNTYSGATLVSGGTLEIAAGATNGGISYNEVAGGVLNISGTVSVASNGMFAIGSSASSTGGPGTVNMNSGVLTIGPSACAYLGGKIAANGPAGLGTFNINGGTVNIGVGLTSNPNGYGDATNFWLNPYGSGGASTINLNGGMLSSARPISDGGNGASVFNFNGGTLQAAAAIGILPNPTLGTDNIRNGGAIIDTQGYKVTLAHMLAHSNIAGDNAIDGGLTKVGSGTLVLSATASTFTGNMTISAGTLNVTAGGLRERHNPALGNPQISGRQITVDAGAAISFTAAHDPLGNEASAPLVQMVLNGGTIITDGHLITLGPIALNGGSMIASNSAAFGYGFDLNGAVTVTGGTSTMAAAGSVYHLNDTGTYVTSFDVAPGATLQISGSSLVNNWSGDASGVTKTDGGTMLLSGTDSYTGVSTVNGGVLEAASIASLPYYGTAGKISVCASGTLAVSVRIVDLDRRRHAGRQQQRRLCRGGESRHRHQQRQLHAQKSRLRATWA